jgi:hypothetical protein
MQRLGYAGAAPAGLNPLAPVLARALACSGLRPGFLAVSLKVRMRGLMTGKAYLPPAFHRDGAGVDDRHWNYPPPVWPSCQV